MNNLKPYIGRYMDKAIFLNHGEFGWYLKFDNKLYGVPQCFQENFTLDKAIKIIDFKNKRKQEETINKESECEIVKKLDVDENVRQGKAKDFLNPNNKPVFKK